MDKEAAFLAKMRAAHAARGGSGFNLATPAGRAACSWCGDPSLTPY
jgi:hypothetical protein